MKAIFKIAPVIMLVVALAPAASADGRPDTVKTTFQVEGMHCDGCSSTITATLEALDGVVEASADHEEGVAEAVYHPRQVKVEDLKTKIEKLGYTVVGMETIEIES
jgi:copper chaperone CopZ